MFLRVKIGGPHKKTHDQVKGGTRTTGVRGGKGKRNLKNHLFHQTWGGETLAHQFRR